MAWRIAACLFPMATVGVPVATGCKAEASAEIEVSGTAADSGTDTDGGGDDDDGDDDDGDDMGDDSPEDDANDDTSDGEPEDDDNGVDDSNDDTDSGVDPGIGLPFSDDFELPEGGPWGPHWQIQGDAITDMVIEGGRGRYSAGTAVVARIGNQNIEAVNVEMWATIVYDDWAVQGFGFYGRQNGGAVQPQPPYGGQGYSVYCEGSTGVVSVWKETNGIEELLAATPRPPVETGVPHRVRLQIEQAGNVTNLRAKMWRESDAEPPNWEVEHQDGTPELQNAAGGIGLDIYNYAGTGSLRIDDIRVEPL